MKKLLQILLMLLVASCSSYLTEDEENGIDENIGKGAYPVTLNVRSGSSGSVEYPINVYVFNQSGKLVEQSVVESPETPFETRLSPGEYTLSAFSGLNNTDYMLPKELSASSIIQPKEGRLCPTPLQHGYCSFKLDRKKSLSIHLAYIVSSLEFKINKIPADASAVEVSVSPVSQGYSMEGEYTNDKQTCSTACHLEGSTWEAGPLYIFPSKSPQSVLSITITRPSGEETLSYSYQYQLQPAQPYRFSGNYNESIGLDGTFEIEGWKPGIDVSFDFTEEGTANKDDTEDDSGNHKDPENGGEGNSSTLVSSTLPEAGKFWQDLYVWKAEKLSENEVKATVLSPKLWFKILAADAPGLLDEYEVDGLSDWRVFTKEEAREFYEEFNTNLVELNKLLTDKGQDEFYFYNGERYFCDDFQSTFNLNGKLLVRNAGQKTEYYMRGIKTVIVRSNH